MKKYFKIHFTKSKVKQPHRFTPLNTYDVLPNEKSVLDFNYSKIDCSISNKGKTLMLRFQFEESTFLSAIGNLGSIIFFFYKTVFVP